jgi:hypothetical protein
MDGEVLSRPTSGDGAVVAYPVTPAQRARVRKDAAAVQARFAAKKATAKKAAARSAHRSSKTGRLDRRDSGSKRAR